MIRQEAEQAEVARQAAAQQAAAANQAAIAGAIIARGPPQIKRKHPVGTAFAA
jgi:hypothetical protein